MPTISENPNPAPDTPENTFKRLHLNAIIAVNAWRRRAVQMEQERNQAQRERDRLLTALRKVKQLIDNTLERYDHAD